MYKEWIVKPNDYLNLIDWDEIVVDGYGHIVLSDGTRIDFADNDSQDIYKNERESYNREL